MGTKKHGLAYVKGVRIPEYNAWHSMKKRCFSSGCKAYKNYGGRGITICERWMDFKNFLNDMGRKPSHKHTIERINNNGNYEPSNCKWATAAEQNRNKRNCISFEFMGRRQLIADWSKELGYDRTLIIDRLGRGWSVEKALSTPPKKRTARNSNTEDIIRLHNEGKTISEISKQLNCNYHTVRSAIIKRIQTRKKRIKYEKEN